VVDGGSLGVFGNAILRRWEVNNTGFIRKNALALSASLGIVLAPLGVSSYELGYGQ